MAVEAPVSKVRLYNLKIYIVGILLIGGWFTYDGYLSKSFIEKHTKNGVADSSLIFNKNAPPVLLAAVIAIGVYMAVIRTKKVIADDNRITINGKLSIPYESITKIDKTHFNTKGGFFLITYKDQLNMEKQIKISDKKYDNLSAVLDKLVEKIS